MGLFRFLVGFFGGLIIFGTLSSFFGLVLISGFTSGSLLFAFGIPTFFLLIGAVMVYYGFFSH